MAGKTVAELRRQRLRKMEDAQGVGELTTLGEAGVSSDDQAAGVRPGAVVHQGPKFVQMYEPHTGNMRLIPAHTVFTARLGGLLMECPHCQGDHDSTTPNACPALEKVAYRECTVCKRHGRTRLFWDEQARTQPSDAEASDDPLNLTPTSEPQTSTPEARLKILWEEHMLVYHPSDARAAGIRPRVN